MDAVLSKFGNRLVVPKTGQQDHHPGIETLADELDMAVGKEEVGAAVVETVKALDVGTIDGAGAPAGRIEAVVGVAADPLEGIRAVLDIALRQQGFTVWLARSGREGIDLYRRHHESIDMVLLDVHMPGLDGPDTLAALQELEPRIPCCFMSGDLGHYTHRQLCSLGAATVIRKPFPLLEVTQMLWDLASHAASPSGQNRTELQPSPA